MADRLGKRQRVKPEFRRERRRLVGMANEKPTNKPERCLVVVSFTGRRDVGVPQGPTATSAFPGANGRSTNAIVVDLNRTLVGWYAYFRHVKDSALAAIDGWIRMRLRSILRKRRGGKGRGHGSDHQRWPNRSFSKLGLFCLLDAHELEMASLRNGANYSLVSRMREIRLSGSEGVQSNAPSIPLLALDDQFPLASRQRIQWRRSRQANGTIRPRTASSVLASGTGTNSPPDAKMVVPE